MEELNFLEQSLRDANEKGFETVAE